MTCDPLSISHGQFPHLLGLDPYRNLSGVEHRMVGIVL